MSVCIRIYVFNKFILYVFHPDYQFHITSLKEQWYNMSILWRHNDGISYVISWRHYEMQTELTQFNRLIRISQVNSI